MMWTEYYKDLPIPSDWEDVSYGNDEYPSFACNGYQIWINSSDKKEREESYIGLGNKDLSNYEDWIFAVCYERDYGNLLDECKHIKREDEETHDLFLTKDFQKTVDFVNEPNLYALLSFLERYFDFQIPFEDFTEKELLDFIKDLLEGKTEYYLDVEFPLDDKFPRKTFETFMKENLK
tara:strand:- start:1219 stop:1752 length:534 start_codon:yes stop_codon:yes gene_type:complete